MRGRRKKQAAQRLDSTRFCRQCGAATVPGDRFCGNCGADLLSVGTTTSVDTQSKSGGIKKRWKVLGGILAVVAILVALPRTPEEEQNNSRQSTQVVAAVSAPTQVNQQDLEQPSALGGLGNTRSDLDLVYGAVEHTSVTDLGDYAIDAVSYADEWVFYLIDDGTAPSPDDRVFIIDHYPDASDSWTYPEAIEVANQLLPADVVPTSDLAPYELTGPAFKSGTVLEHRQTFYSESIARLFPDPELYREGDPGTVWLLLTLDYGSVDPSNNFASVSVRIEHP